MRMYWYVNRSLSPGQHGGWTQQWRWWGGGLGQLQLPDISGTLTAASDGLSSTVLHCSCMMPRPSGWVRSPSCAWWPPTPSSSFVSESLRHLVTVMSSSYDGEWGNCGWWLHITKTFQSFKTFLALDLSWQQNTLSTAVQAENINLPD